MKTLQEIKDEYFIESGYLKPEQAIFDMSVGCSKLQSAIKLERHYNEISKIFAIEVAKQALINASESAKLDWQYFQFEEASPFIDKQSIINQSNIPTL